MSWRNDCYVAGAGDISVRQARRLIALRACAMVAESAMSETFFFQESKENLTRASIDPGIWCMKDRCIHH